MIAGWLPRALAVHLLLVLIVHGARPIVSYKALALNAGPLAVGVIAASFAGLSFVIAVPAGRWIDRRGEIGWIAAGAIIVAVAAVGLAVSQNLIHLALAMLLLGAGHIIASIGIQTLIANGGPPQSMDSRFASQTVAASIGQLAGPALAGMIVGRAVGDARDVSVAATNGVFWASAEATVVAFLLVLTLWWWPPTKHTQQSMSAQVIEEDESLMGTISRLLRIKSMPQAFLVGAAVLSSLDVIIAYLPVYGAAHGIPVETIGLLLAVRGGSSIVVRAIMLPLRKAFGHRGVLIGSLALPGLALVVVPTFGPHVGLLYLTMAIVGGGLGLSVPLTISWIASKAAPDIRGSAFGLRLSFNRLCQFVLPSTVGFVAGGTGVAAIFFVLGLLLLVATAVASRTSID